MVWKKEKCNSEVDRKYWFRDRSAERDQAQRRVRELLELIWREKEAWVIRKWEQMGLAQSESSGVTKCGRE